MERLITVLVSAVVFSCQSAWAADLPRAIVDPYLQIQVALAGDRFAGIAPLAQSLEAAAIALGKDGEKLAAGARTLVAARGHCGRTYGVWRGKPATRSLC